MEMEMEIKLIKTTELENLFIRKYFARFYWKLTLKLMGSFFRCEKIDFLLICQCEKEANPVVWFITSEMCMICAEVQGDNFFKRLSKLLAAYNYKLVV